MKQGMYDRAEPLLERGRRILESRLGKEHSAVATCLGCQADLCRDLGRYARAERLYRRSLAIRVARLGKDHPDVATCLNNAAQLFEAEGRYALAEQSYRRALDILEARLGKDHPALATCLNNLGMLCTAQKRHAAAQKLFERSLQIREARLGKDHPEVAECLNNLAVIHERAGEYDRAEACYQRSQKINEARLGKDHPLTTIALLNLAGLHQARGRHDTAGALFRHCCQALEAALGPDHPYLATAQLNLASLYAAGRHWDRAAEPFDRASRTLHRHVSRVLPALAEPVQLTFLRARWEPCFQAALSLGLVRGQDRGMAEGSAAWLLNGKAVANQALAETTLLARASRNPRQAMAFRELRSVRQQSARLALALPRAGQEARRRQELARLASREGELVRQLGQDNARPAPRWVQLDAVRQALPGDAVLIDVARVTVADFQANRENKWGTPHYAAWVIPARGQGEVQVIDLGDARQIEADVQAARRALQAAPLARRGDREAGAERELRRILEPLARRLLAPLAGAAGKARRWIVSPDASLWLVPWGALPLPDGSYALEKHAISYVTCARDLVQPRSREAAGACLVLADPEFDLKPPEAPQESLPASVRGSLLPRQELPRFERLAGTLAEARAVAPLLRRYAGAEPQVRTGRETAEGVFKAARRPRVVLLSTHGFFLEDQQVVALPGLRGPERGLRLIPRQPAGPRPQKPQAPENPLLRCGLALAGANQRDRAPDGAEDGILTGLEVVGCDLRGTELVVLSACDTGLGKVHVGEGVAGLRQAFQLAGAQAVVATLWQIPDRETTALMTAFFTHLAGKKGKAEALRQAQLDIIKQRRAQGKAAHPYYWAAFTLTGQWQ
jgi:CHAT domain-containing protein